MDGKQYSQHDRTTHRKSKFALSHGEASKPFDNVCNPLALLSQDHVFLETNPSLEGVWYITGGFVRVTYSVRIIWRYNVPVPVICRSLTWNRDFKNRLQVSCLASNERPWYVTQLSCKKKKKGQLTEFDFCSFSLSLSLSLSVFLSRRCRV